MRTGVKDKNNKEIYVGDIVKYEQHHLESLVREDFIGVVKCYIVDNNVDFSCALFQEDGKFEVVGNIYEKGDKM